MHIGRPEGPERRHASQELNGLQLAAKVEFDHVAERKAVGRGQRESLERTAVQAEVRRRQAPHGQGKRRLTAVSHLVAKRSPYYGGRRNPAVSDVALQSDCVGGGNRSLR